MTTTNKDFKVKNGIVVSDGGTFGGPVAVGTPTDPSHAVTLDYLEGLSFSGAMVVSETAPESAGSGDIWFDSTSGATFVYYDSYWIQVMSATGPQGEPGADGEDALWNFIGEYDNGADYSPGDLVTYNGGTYYRVGEPNPGYPPGTSYWTIIAEPGPAGTDGVTPSAPWTLALSTTTDTDPLTIQSKNGHGGTGFSGILTIENTTTGATNGKKFLRMTSTGAIEFINNAYSATIFSLSDEGNLSISGTMNGSTLGDTGWQSVSSFNNGYSGANVAYRRINNVVYLRGSVNGGTANASAFNLPSGYRPSTSGVVVPVQQYGTSNINYVTVGTDGNVTPNGTAAWLHSVVYPIG